MSDRCSSSPSPWLFASLNRKLEIRPVKRETECSGVKVFLRGISRLACWLTGEISVTYHRSADGNRRNSCSANRQRLHGSLFCRLRRGTLSPIRSRARSDTGVPERSCRSVGMQRGEGLDDAVSDSLLLAPQTLCDKRAAREKTKGREHLRLSCHAAEGRRQRLAPPSNSCPISNALQ